MGSEDSARARVERSATPTGVGRAPRATISTRSRGRPPAVSRFDAARGTPWRPGPNLHVSQHPAVLHKLAILRDETTEPKKFREVVRELSWLLGYEALADARVRPLDGPDAARGDGRPTSSASGSGSSRSCGRASAWSTRCSS